MRVLGINVAAQTAWLALADGEDVLEVRPLKLEAHVGLDAGSGLVAVKDGAKRILRSHEATRLRVLGAESLYQDSYSRWVPPLTLESMFLLAAAELDLDGRRLTRQKVKSVMRLQGRGSLDVLAAAHRATLEEEATEVKMLAATLHHHAGEEERLCFRSRMRLARRRWGRRWSSARDSLENSTVTQTLRKAKREVLRRV